MSSIDRLADRNKPPLDAAVDQEFTLEQLQRIESIVNIALASGDGPAWHSGQRRFSHPGSHEDSFWSDYSCQELTTYQFHQTSCRDLEQDLSLLSDRWRGVSKIEARLR